MFGTDFLLCHHFYDLPLLDDILTKGVHSLCLGLEQRLANPEYCGLLYMPSHYSWMACEDLFASRQFMSTSWLYPRLTGMLDSLSFWTLAITMFDVFCRDLREGGGVFAEARIFLSPLLPRDVWLRPTCIPWLTVAAFLPGDCVLSSLCRCTA